MALDIKFNYPHTFFLSIGLALFIFGVTPFYLGSFDYTTSQDVVKIITHIVSVIISLVCLGKGISLWEAREREQEGFRNIRKETMQQELEIITRKNEMGNSILKLESLKKDEEKTGEELKKKNEEIKKLDKKIDSQKKDIIGAKAKLYSLRKDEIEKIPDSNMSSGAIVLGSNTPNLSGYTGSATSWNGFSTLGSPYPGLKTICPVCNTPNEVGCRKCEKCGNWI
ncbi:hypothetical protein KAS08_03245 [Candidatus Pacearchaeota archaeon]|nr:hypothetical protein [Candidatus Pacearchaeota archaeon]